MHWRENGQYSWEEPLSAGRAPLADSTKTARPHLVKVNLSHSPMSRARAPYVHLGSCARRGATGSMDRALERRIETVLFVAPGDSVQMISHQKILPDLATLTENSAKRE